MKYLFGVNDLCSDTVQLYTIEAESIEKAKEIFTRKFLPHVSRVDFDTLADCLARGMDVVISSLGPISQIEEL